jgi:hypothetical protein
MDAHSTPAGDPRTCPGAAAGVMDRRRFLTGCGKAAAALVVLSAAAPLAACGGSSGSAASPAASPKAGTSASPSPSGSTDPTGSAFYLAHKAEYMPTTEGFAKGLEAAMAQEYGAKVAATIAEDMVADFEEVLAELPYIGGNDKGSMTSTLVNCAMSMSYCLAMMENGRSMDDAGRYNYFACAAAARMHPVPKSDRYQPTDVAGERREARGWAAWTQEGTYPQNWVAEYVGGLPKPYTYGYDFTQCANVGVCKHLGIPKFTRYLCMLDKVQYEAIGQGMTRTKTIADGSDCCDFHFRTDGVVRLGEPFTALKFREWGAT